MHESTARLYLAASRIRGVTGQTNVAKALNQSPQTVKNWESRGVSKEGALLVEQILGVRPAWILRNEGDMVAEAKPPLIAGEAHHVRLYERTVPPTVTWEWVMQAKVPMTMKEFRVAMPDDALAPKVARGTPLEFDSGKAPRFGEGVLVEDADGRRFVRVYKEDHAGQWRAAPINPAYATLDSDRDGLTVLATLTAVVDGRLI
ncbi:MAG: hypothetical protein AB9M53_00505 [Leptothrix sp. (in: b-proteobacteria)]